MLNLLATAQQEKIEKKGRPEKSLKLKD